MRTPRESIDVSEVGRTITTAEQFDQSGDKTPLDCLLHGEHHIFDTDCWDHLIYEYRRLKFLFPDDDHTKLMDRYCLKYEFEITHVMINDAKWM